MLLATVATLPRTMPYRVDPFLTDLVLVIRIGNVQTSLFDPLAKHGIAGSEVGPNAPVEGIVGFGNVIVTPEKGSGPRPRVAREDRPCKLPCVEGHDATPSACQTRL
jgi:hypothetical protein